MQLIMLSGYPDNVGRRHMWCGYGHGPKSYDREKKDPLAEPTISFTFDAIIPALSSSGDYMVYGFASGVGARQRWALKWVKAEDGEEVEDDQDLSQETVQLAGFGGQF